MYYLRSTGGMAVGNMNLGAICIALGLAFIMVGAGINVAYRQKLLTGHDPTSQPNKQPDWLTLEWLLPVLQNFLRGAWACFAIGAALVAVGLLSGVELQPRATDPRVPVSLYYAVALALLLVALSYNVLRFRVRATLTNTDRDLAAGEHMARVHANFTEYAPTGLALLIVLEWAGAPLDVVHVGGAIFTAGRYVHAWGYAFETAPSLPRILGIQSTLLALCYMAVMAVIYVAAT